MGAEPQLEPMKKPNENLTHIDRTFIENLSNLRPEIVYRESIENLWKVDRTSVRRKSIECLYKTHRQYIEPRPDDHRSNIYRTSSDDNR